METRVNEQAGSGVSSSIEQAAGPVVNRDVPHPSCNESLGGIGCELLAGGVEGVEEPGGGGSQEIGEIDEALPETVFHGGEAMAGLGEAGGETALGLTSSSVEVKRGFGTSPEEVRGAKHT